MLRSESLLDELEESPGSGSEGEAAQAANHEWNHDQSLMARSSSSELDTEKLVESVLELRQIIAVERAQQDNRRRSIWTSAHDEVEGVRQEYGGKSWQFYLISAIHDWRTYIPIVLLPLPLVCTEPTATPQRA